MKTFAFDKIARNYYRSSSEAKSSQSRRRCCRRDHVIPGKNVFASEIIAGYLIGHLLIAGIYVIPEPTDVIEFDNEPRSAMDFRVGQDSPTAMATINFLISLTKLAFPKLSSYLMIFSPTVSRSLVNATHFRHIKKSVWNLIYTFICYFQFLPLTDKKILSKISLDGKHRCHSHTHKCVYIIYYCKEYEYMLRTGLRSALICRRNQFGGIP